MLFSRVPDAGIGADILDGGKGTNTRVVDANDPTPVSVELP